MSANYSSSHYQSIARVEANHFWFRARNRLLKTLIWRFLPPSGPRWSFLEVGFGTGIVLRMLNKLGMDVSGIDINHEALRYARRHAPDAQLWRTSLFSFRPGRQFEAVGAFDVLEHQRDDLAFLKRCYGLLAPGGYLFLTVPAGKWLWSSIDVISGHARRYNPEELLAKLSRAGFDVRFWNFWQVTTLPLYLIWRRWQEARDDGLETYLAVPPRPFNFLCYLSLVLEGALLFFCRFPWGATLVVVAQRHK